MTLNSPEKRFLNERALVYAAMLSQGLESNDALDAVRALKEVKH